MTLVAIEDENYKNEWRATWTHDRQKILDVENKKIFLIF